MNKTDTFIQALGWFGAIALLAAFALSSFDVISSDALLYQVLNSAGAFTIALAAFRRKSYQPAVLNIIWGTVAVLAVGKILLG